jgi:Zn-dependent peptidase ImmA (M78 family)
MAPAYANLKRLALEKRAKFHVETSSLNLTKLRGIYKAEGISIDLRALSARIRAVYMCEGGDPSVLVNRTLPKEPRIFAMAHELKHHYLDQAALGSGETKCGDYNANHDTEVGAEVFAAEFVYPESEFLNLIGSMGLEAGSVKAEQVVHFKRACPAPVSYRFIWKRLAFLGYVPADAFRGIQFPKLEERMFGVPFYKEPWFRTRRRRGTPSR